MSQLILLRQRIRAIETIKKITHAMQLISMSMHSRLRQKRMQIDHYYKEIVNFWDTLSEVPISFFVPENVKEHILLIVIGSQKGLAGNYTQALFGYFEQEYATIKKQAPVSIIAVGRQLLQQFEHRGLEVYKAFDTLTLTQIPVLAHTILKEITVNPHYTKVLVINSYQKTFFIQRQQISQLVPLYDTQTTKKRKSSLDYYWEQDKNEVIMALAELKLYAKIQDLLIESLSAEAAARFISMQNATENADALLHDMKLEFNKRRQTKITLELSELAASYSSK